MGRKLNIVAVIGRMFDIMEVLQMQISVLEEKKRMPMDEVAEVELRELLPIAGLIVVLILFVAYGLQILGETQDDMTIDSPEYNATATGILAVAKIPSKTGLLVTVIMASAVLGVLITYMYKKFFG